MSTELVMPSNHLTLCHPLLPSIFPNIRVFSNESALHIRWPKYRSFSFSIILSNEYSGLTSFTIDYFHLLAVQEILKSILQHHSLEASILRHSTFFPVQLSHAYMITGKIIAFTIRTFVGKVMSLLFNMLSRLVRAFPPRTNFLLILWLQSLSAVILEPKNIKSASFHFFPFYLLWSDGTRCHDLSFWMWVSSQLFHSPLSSSLRDSSVPLHFLPLEWYHLHVWGCGYFSQQAWFQLVIHPMQHFTWCTLNRS